MTSHDHARPEITVLRIRLAADPPGRARFYLCSRTIARRLVVNALDSGDDVADLGPDALMYAQAAKPAAFHSDGHHHLVLVGIADGDRWALWTPPSPVEPVPGSRGAAAQAN